LLAGGVMLLRKDKLAVVPLTIDPLIGTVFFMMNRI